jgi:hypothetical protein
LLAEISTFWLIIREVFFESGSTEATKIKKKYGKFLSINSALFEH